MSLLQVIDLKKEYQTAKNSLFLAVDHINLSVSPGECFGLLGPNGAGKSTSINCITGFYPPTSGRVLINGFDVHQDPKKARKLLGVCPQEDTLDTDFDCLDQLVRHAAFFRITGEAAKRKAEELLVRFDLKDKAYQPVEHLSGGMRRKLQVARAMISDPKVLVLDEPTTGLDPEARRTLWNVLVKTREQGVATLLSTHYMDEAERLCDRVALLDQGKILDVASPQELIQKHVGSELIEEEVRPGVTWKRPPNLEDVFLKITGKKLGVEGQ